MTITTAGCLPGELGDQFERGVGIGVIVVAELLALHLLGLRDALAVRADRSVERGLLVRVLAVAQFVTGALPLTASMSGNSCCWSANANHWLIIAS